MPDRSSVRQEHVYSLMLLLFLSLAGCGRQENVPMTTAILPSGVIETTYAELPLHPLAVDTVAVWDVWSGEAGYLFSRLTAVVGFEDGFYVLDSGNRQVVETDLRGRVRNVFGQRGEGPGEFGYPRFLNIVADEVWVGDIMPMRFSIFDRDGSFRRTVPSQARLAPDQNRCAILPDGRILNALDDLDGVFSLLAWNLQTATADTLARCRSMPPIIIELHRSDGRVVPFDTRPSFAAELHWSFDGTERLVTVTGEEYIFEERDCSGRIVRRTLAPTPDLSVSEQDRDYFFAHSAFGTGDGSSISEEEIRRKWRFAEQRQAIGRIRIDPLGRIWVLAHTGDIERNRVDLFDAEHLYLGSFEAPMLPLAFAADGTALLRADDGPNGEGVFYSARVH